MVPKEEKVIAENFPMLGNRTESTNTGDHGIPSYRNSRRPIQSHKKETKNVRTNKNCLLNVKELLLSIYQLFSAESL